MTDQYNAAQPGENLLGYAMAIAHERELDVTGHKHDSDGAVRRFKAAAERALLSKLRAEGVQAGDERAAVDPCGFVAVKRSAVDWLKDKFPLLTIKAGICERIGGRLYTITRLMADHDAALASAPVAEPYDSEMRCRAYYDSDLRPFAADGVTYDVWKAVWHAAQFDRAMHPNSSKPRPHSAPVVGEAVYTLRVRGAIQAWTPTAAAFSIPDGEHQLFLSPAAPQASAEPLARYCPGCGSVGPVGDEYRDCCPDGNQARMIPKRLAEKCRDTFRLAIQTLLADAAANDSATPQATEAVRILFPTHLRKMWSGGEVQAWLDNHQGITPPTASAKGSLERYRNWRAEQAEADKDGVRSEGRQ